MEWGRISPFLFRFSALFKNLCLIFSPYSYCKSIQNRRIDFNLLQNLASQKLYKNKVSLIPYILPYILFSIHYLTNLSDSSRNKFEMTTLDLFCLLIALTLPHQGLLHPAHIVMLNLFQHMSERHTVKNLGLFCFKNNDFFSSSSDRSRNKFGMMFLDLFYLLISSILPHKGLLHPAHIVMLNSFQHLSERLTKEIFCLSIPSFNLAVRQKRRTLHLLK